MSTVQEIQVAIQELHPDQYQQLAKWWEQHNDRLWDAQIGNDSQPGGRLRKLLTRIDSDIDAGHVTSFPK
jgi:hypothetical protein